MIDKVNTLIDAIRPARLVKDLNIEVHSKKECYFINEPGSTSNCLFLKDKEFVNSNLKSDFAAGNVVSFLVHYFDKTFEEAIDYLLKKYFNKLSQPIYSAVSWASSSMASYLEAHSTLFKSLQRHKKLLNQDFRYSKCKQYLRKHGFNENYVKDIVAPFTGEELNDLFAEVSHEFSGLSRNFSKKQLYLIFPIHINYSFISAIWIFCLRTQKTQKFQIMPYSRGFFGLHNLRVSDTCVYVLPTVSDVIAESHTFYDHGGHNSQTCISIAYNNEEAALSPDPIYRGLMVISEDTKATDIIRTQASFHELGLLNKNQRFKVGFDQAREARTYLINKFILDANQRNNSDDVLVEKLTKLQTDPIIMDRIQNFLKTTNKTKLMSLINSNLYKSEIKNIKGSVVTQSKDGYVASGKKGLPDVLFTNFTVNLNRTVMFKDSTDTYYIGELYTGSRRLPYMLSKREINQAMHIVNAANASVASARDLEDIKPPALLDSTFAGVLRGIIADQISDSKIELGVARLGWSDRYDAFTAPGWSAIGSSFTKNSGFSHPTVQILNNYNFTPKSIDRISVTFNVPSVNILLALVTSMLGRGFHDMRCSPIRVLNNESNRLLLASLLSIFQQKRTIDLNPNLRVSRREEQMLPGIRGLPMVCSCSNPQVIDRIYDPVFALSNSGMDFTTDEEFKYNDLSDFSSYYFPYLINELIQTDGSIFNPDYEDRSVEAMIKEGLNTMRLLFPTEVWFITKSNHHELQNWLCQQSLELFQESIKLDFENQKIRINLQAFPNFPKIKEYLEAAKISMYKMSKHYLVVDSEAFLKLLDEIFVEVPKIGSCTIQDYNSKRKVTDKTDDVRLG